MIRLLSFLIPFSLLALPLAPVAEASVAAPVSAQAALPKTVLRGVIVKIDATKQTFVLKTQSGHAVLLKATDKTRISVDGQPANFDDLALGMKARVRAKKVPGKKLFVALRIRAKS